MRARLIETKDQRVFRNGLSAITCTRLPSFRRVRDYKEVEKQWQGGMDET